MKRIFNLKLTQLGKAELISREMNSIRGGTDDDNTCNCGCAAIAVRTNMEANAYYGYQKSAGYGDFDDYGDGQVSCSCASSAPMATTRGIGHFADCLPC